MNQPESLLDDVIADLLVQHEEHQRSRTPVAQMLAAHPPQNLMAETKRRFEEAFGSLEDD